jgi:uncharacterized protein YcfL
MYVENVKKSKHYISICDSKPDTPEYVIQNQIHQTFKLHIHRWGYNEQGIPVLKQKYKDNKKYSLVAHANVNV